MDFLRHIHHVKPVRRQWRYPSRPQASTATTLPGQVPANLEEITYYLRYLLALPTLRLTRQQPLRRLLHHATSVRGAQSADLPRRRSPDPGPGTSTA